MMDTRTASGGGGGGGRRVTCTYDSKRLDFIRTALFGLPSSLIASDGTVSIDSNKKLGRQSDGVSSDSRPPDTVQVLSLSWLALETAAARNPLGAARRDTGAISAKEKRYTIL